MCVADSSPGGSESGPLLTHPWRVGDRALDPRPPGPLSPNLNLLYRREMARTILYEWARNDIPYEDQLAILALCQARLATSLNRAYTEAY